MVNVPVLSEQITEVQPKVSTDGNDLTIAFFLAILRVPKAKHVVITAGKPSGEIRRNKRNKSQYKFLISRNHSESICLKKRKKKISSS